MALRSKKIYVFERLLIGLILFYGGLFFCLPNSPTEEIELLYPWWGKRIALGNIILHELIFLLWLAIYGSKFIIRSLLNVGVPTRQAAIWLVFLAVWCGLISLSTPFPLQDLGRTFRLILNGILLVSVVRWTKKTGTFPMTMFVSGFLVGTIINLELSFRYPLIVYDTMRLSGQNTAGVAMGIAVHMAAWLFYMSKSSIIQILSLCSTFVFSFSCAISYSRIGWFVGGLGLFVWFVILVFARPIESSQVKRFKRLRGVMIPLLLVILIAAPLIPIVQTGMQWIGILVQQKNSAKGESDSARWGYLHGTTEIILQYPWGVGYSGFYDAMTRTDTYRSGNAAQEESRVDANPHASFLWYASAGGIPGVLLTFIVFGLLLNSMRVGLVSAMGLLGLVLFVAIALSYCLIGSTVPYLFNSMILIVPAAIAAGWGWSKKVARISHVETVFRVNMS